jgi:hypothetical protein
MLKRLLAVILLFLLAEQANADLTITVPSNPLWTDTGKYFNNSSFSIAASGSWSWGGDPAYFFGPEGDTSSHSGGGPGWLDNWVSNGNHGSLIGYIGNDPNSASSGWFNVGSSAKISNVTGELWLGFNDDKVSGALADNSGSVTAVITTVPEPEAWVMMLLGTWMVGIQVKRKKNQSSFIA